MNISSIKALFKKEISDIFRDKKTLFMMVVIPLVLYPLMIIGMTLLMSSIMTNQVESVYKVAFENVPHADKLEALLSDEEQDFTYELEVVDVEDASKALSDGEIDAYVSFKPEKGSGKGEEFVTSADGVVSLNGSLQITYYEADEDSSTAEQALEDLINAYQDVLRSENIKKLNLEEDAILYPLPYTAVGLSSVEETMGSIVGSVIPMMIIVSILMGAIYPAIDVTAGEKERGTLETLLTLPVTNLEMITSKFLAVAVISCISAVLNIISMGAACGFMMSMMTEGSESAHINFASFIPAVLITMVVMIAFALFVTAVCMCVCVFAKSFKEANNYVTPVMLVFMFGGFAGMIPNLELTSTTAAMPIINVALLIDQLFQFKYDYALLGVVFITNVIYSLITVMILARIYNSEAILFSEGLSSVKIVKKRSEMKKGQMPGIGDIVLLLCVVLLLILYVGSYVQLKFGFAGAVVQQLIILLCPVLYVWYMKADVKKLFSIRTVKPLQLLGSVLLGIGAFVAALLLGAVLAPIFPESAEGLSQLDQMLNGQSTIVLILVVAVMPAIGEELLFRGFVMGSLREKCKPVITVLVTTLIFAAYHMSLIKMFTIGLIGLGFTLAAYKTGSIFASMCVHFCNNLLSVLMTKHPDRMKQVLPILFKEKMTVADVVLLVAVMVVCAGLGWWLIRGKNGDQRREE